MRGRNHCFYDTTQNPPNFLDIVPGFSRQLRKVSATLNPVFGRTRTPVICCKRMFKIATKLTDHGSKVIFSNALTFLRAVISCRENTEPGISKRFRHRLHGANSTFWTYGTWVSTALNLHNSSSNLVKFWDSSTTSARNRNTCNRSGSGSGGAIFIVLIQPRLLFSRRQRHELFPGELCCRNSRQTSLYLRGSKRWNWSRLLNRNTRGNERTHGRTCTQRKRRL